MIQSDRAIEQLFQTPPYRMRAPSLVSELGASAPYLSP